jgi:hemolysin III
VDSRRGSWPVFARGWEKQSSNVRDTPTVVVMKDGIPNPEQVRPAIRDWSRREEMASGLSHGVAFLATLVGAPFLLNAASEHGGSRLFIGVSVFAASTMLLYLSSALHHWWLAGRTKDLLEVLDHAAIYLVIAGTYMPFAVGVLWGPWGWLLMGVIWPLAIFGVLLITVRGLQPRLFTVSLYVAMGLLFFIAIRPLAARVPTPGLLLILGGGAAYLGGLIFYFARRFHYHHLAWHLCVLVGTALHYFAVLRYSF